MGQYFHIFNVSIHSVLRMQIIALASIFLKKKFLYFWKFLWSNIRITYLPQQGDVTSRDIVNNYLKRFEVVQSIVVAMLGRGWDMAKTVFVNSGTSGKA